jgi:uncharacterized protein YjbJ (UPF0337 family)
LLYSTALPHGSGLRFRPTANRGRDNSPILVNFLVDSPRSQVWHANCNLSFHLSYEINGQRKHRRMKMKNNHVKGTWNEVKGRVKEEVGHATGDSQTEAEGVVDRVKGKVQKEVGNLKDAIKRGVDHVLEHKPS